jgi:orotate phosphoribosyltransferase
MKEGEVLDICDIERGHFCFSAYTPRYDKIHSDGCPNINTYSPLSVDQAKNQMCNVFGELQYADAIVCGSTDSIPVAQLIALELGIKQVHCIDPKFRYYSTLCNERAIVIDNMVVTGDRLKRNLLDRQHENMEILGAVVLVDLTPDGFAFTYKDKEIKARSVFNRSDFKDVINFWPAKECELCSSRFKRVLKGVSKYPTSIYL